jgi:long-chain acyl-CoA synthetase
MAGRNLYQMFLETVARYGDRNAVGFRANKNEAHRYWSYREYAQRVRDFRRGLDALGLRKGDRVALISHENRVEWAIMDLAAQALGLITVPIYGTLPAPQVAYYLQDSGARAILVSDAKQRAKIATIRTEAPALEFVIAMDGEAAALNGECVLTFADVYRRGETAGRDEATLDAIIPTVLPDDIATFIYTSGTTGEPKGAMVTHNNLLQTPDAVVDEPIATLGPDDVFLSFLPLSHITERVGGYYLPLRAGCCIVYSLGLMNFSDELTTTVRPTLLLSVPRLWENAREKALDRIAKEPEKRRRIIEWGLKVGKAVAHRRSASQSIGPLLALQQMVAERLVHSRLREKVTGGRLRFCVSGGAPLDRETAEFFLGIGVQILEGYGLTETNIIAINRPGRQRIGTVGNLLANAEIKLADDGEILMRGQGRMKGYYNKPEATAEAIDEAGWFHTGDIGELSQDGYLKITDRKKDLLVLSNGKKVAPQPIEALLKQSPYIGEAVLFADRQSTVMALLVPAFDKLLPWAKANGLATDNVAALLESAEVQKLYRADVDKLTVGLADFEKVRRYKLVSQPFGIESGELTPTLKVKRKFVAQKYADLLAAMARG